MVFYQANNNQRRGDTLRNNRSQSHSRHVHLHHYYKKQIQPHIDYAGRREEI